MTDFKQKDFADPIKGRKLRRRFPVIRILLLILLILGFYRYEPEKPQTEQTLTEAGAPPKKENAPQEASLKKENEPKTEKKEDTFQANFLSRQKDKQLALNVLNVLGSQKPFGAVYLMVDGANGEILAWGQQQNFAPQELPSYLPDSSFPAASLVKIVTAAAALESRRYSNHTEIPAIGRSVTLYKNQLEVPKNYNGKRVTLEKAFSLSMNSPIGIVGLDLGSKRLMSAAERLGFNRLLAKGVPLESRYPLPSDDFAIAEAASGFTDDITISPLLAAAIVRSILLGKDPEMPWSPLLAPAYAPVKAIGLNQSPFKENTYYGLKRMLETTLKKGSARTSYNNPKVFYPYNKERLRTGGKTGTKNVGNIRYEWYAGYARDRKNAKKALILVCLHMNEINGTRASHPAQASALLTNYWAKSYLQW